MITVQNSTDERYRRMILIFRTDKKKHYIGIENKIIYTYSAVNRKYLRNLVLLIRIEITRHE